MSAPDRSGPALLRDDAIRRACRGQGARWSEARRSGLTDHDLRAVLSAELGEGGSGGPQSLAECHRGGTDPTIWLNVYSQWLLTPADDEQPIEVLRGKQLLTEVRRALAIPYPVGDGTAVVQATLL